MATPSDVRIRAPPSATPRAAAMWKQNPLSRFYDLVYLTDEKADDYTRLLFESFSVGELQVAVSNMYDIRPLVRERSMVDQAIVGKLACSIIRAHWHKLSVRLRSPGHILGLLQRSDTSKWTILNTPEGRRWLNWTCYEVEGLLAYYARPRDYKPMPPPPGSNPLRPIPQPVLEASERQG